MTLITTIAYDPERDLGRAYNEIMERLRPGDWVCFLDHDAIFTTRDWYLQILEAISRYPEAGLFGAVTNRIGNQAQIAPGCPRGHDMREHRIFGEMLRVMCGSNARDVTQETPISGVVLILSYDSWKRMGRFRSGFLGVDNQAHYDVAKNGMRVLLLDGLYVYHWYRADGVGHKNPPRVAPA